MLDHLAESIETFEIFGSLRVTRLNETSIDRVARETIYPSMIKSGKKKKEKNTWTEILHVRKMNLAINFLN